MIVLLWAAAGVPGLLMLWHGNKIRNRKCRHNWKLPYVRRWNREELICCTGICLTLGPCMSIATCIMYAYEKWTASTTRNAIRDWLEKDAP